jgi:hypothetical protein
MPRPLNCTDIYTWIDLVVVAIYQSIIHSITMDRLLYIRVKFGLQRGLFLGGWFGRQSKTLGRLVERLCCTHRQLGPQLSSRLIQDMNIRIRRKEKKGKKEYSLSGRKNRNIHLILRRRGKLCSTGSKLDRPPDRTIGRFFIFLYNSAVGVSYSSFHVFCLDGSSSALNLQVKSAMCCTFLMAAFRVWLEKPKPFRCYLNRRRIIRQFFFSFSWVKVNSYANSPHKSHPPLQYIQIEYFYRCVYRFPAGIHTLQTDGVECV